MGVFLTKISLLDIFCHVNPILIILGRAFGTFFWSQYCCMFDKEGHSGCWLVQRRCWVWGRGHERYVWQFSSSCGLDWRRKMVDDLWIGVICSSCTYQIAAIMSSIYQSLRAFSQSDTTRYRQPLSNPSLLQVLDFLEKLWLWDSPSGSHAFSLRIYWHNRVHLLNQYNSFPMTLFARL